MKIKNLDEKRKIIAFIGAALSFTFIYAAAALPIPLYSIYKEKIGITNGYLSISSVIYFFGTVTALLCFARVSNHLGRRFTTLIILLTTIIGCIIFKNLHSGYMLLIGRFLQGFSCGMASSTVTAYIIDTVPEKIKNWGTIIAGNAHMIGLAVGSLGCGILVNHSFDNGKIVFEITIIILILLSILILFGAETAIVSGNIFKSIIPQIKIPKNIKKYFPAAASTFIGTWAVGGFYQAFSAPIAFEQFDISNTMIAAIIFTCLQSPSIIGGVIAGKLKTEKAQKIGMFCFFLSMTVVTFSMEYKMIILFLIATIFTGMFWAIAFTASLKNILNNVTFEERAGTLSLVYLVSYSGAAIPNLIVGKVLKYFNLVQVAGGYTILAGIMFGIVFISNLNHFKLKD